MFKGWKKVSTENAHTVMRNKEGHELRIAHSALSPKLRGQLAEIEVHNDEEAPQKMSKGGKLSMREQRQSMVDAAQGKPERKPLGSSTPHPYESKPTKLSPTVLKGETAAPKSDPEAQRAKEDAESIPVDFKRHAHGGEVQKLADGGDVLEPELDINLSPTAPPILPDSLQNPNTLPEVSPQPEALFGTTPETAPQSVGSPMALPPGIGVQPPMPTPAPTTPAPEAAIPDAAAAPQEAALPTPGIGLQSGLGGGQEKQAQGLRQEAAAQSVLGAKEAEIQQTALENQQEVAAGFEEKQKLIMDEFNAVKDDIKAGHIDPTRYLGNMSTPGKVMTAIGLLLGGLGGGSSDRNPAMDILNKDIEADIDAQKAEMNKKVSLLSAIDKQFGNLQASTNIARAMMQDQVISQLKKAEAESKDPIAKARATQAIGMLEAQQQAALAPTAKLLQIQELQKAVEADPANGMKYLDRINMIDPKAGYDLRQRYVPGSGFASTRQGALDVKTLKTTVDSAKDGLKRLLEINKIPGKSLSPSLRAEAGTIAQTLIGALRVPLTGPGALNQSEHKMLTEVVSNPTSVFALSSNNKIRLEALMKRLDVNLGRAMAANGLRPPDPAALLNPREKTFYNWAKSNPNHPKAQMFLKKVGLD